MFLSSSCTFRYTPPRNNKQSLFGEHPAPREEGVLITWNLVVPLPQLMKSIHLSLPPCYYAALRHQSRWNFFCSNTSVCCPKPLISINTVRVFIVPGEKDGKRQQLGFQRPIRVDSEQSMNESSLFFVLVCAMTCLVAGAKQVISFFSNNFHSLALLRPPLSLCSVTNFCSHICSIPI